MATKKIIGIDLGTTNSVAAIYEAGEPIVIANQHGDRLTPSVVGFQTDGSKLVGRLAKNQAVQNPTRTVFSIKRFMGRRHEEVTEDEKLVPYDLGGEASDPVKVNIDDKGYTAPEISAMVLRSIKEYVEDYLGEDVTEAVITVPAYFNDAQRQATKDAGTIAGLQVKRIVNEPTAAALAYGLNTNEEGTIAVFDFGGGTFDISILEISKVDKETVFEVRATNGDTHLGGDDLDEALIGHIADEFQKENQMDLRKDQMALQRLKEAAEKAKCELSTTVSTQINLPFITQGANRTPLHLNMTISRATFEQLIEPIVQRLYEPCQSCLEDAGLKPNELKDLILVGGSTRIPKVQELAEEIFQRKPSKSLNPDEVVALGAAVQAHILADPAKANITFLDVTPLSLGIETEGGLMHVLIERNTTIPAQRQEVFTTAADNQDHVNVFVYQGEREIAGENRLLGNFRLDGIPPAKRGIPQIEVTFDIDANGILEATAKDKGTNKSHHIVIESSSGLSKTEVDKMKREAEQHATDDAKRKDGIEKRNDAEHIVYRAKDLIKDSGDKLESAAKSKLETAISSMETALASEDSDMDSTTQALQDALQSAAASLYQAATADEPEVEASDGDDEPEEIEVVLDEEEA